MKRSRLLTATIDGKLDIWDFDAAKHIIYKDQSIPTKTLPLNNALTFDTAFNLIGSESIPGLCMILTSKNIMVKKKRHIEIGRYKVY